MQAVTRTTNYISETAQRTIALNLAKEGIEAVYNIRNTNWRRRSSQRNQCWLKADPMVDTGSEGCQNDLRLHNGRWGLREKVMASSQSMIFYLHPVATLKHNPAVNVHSVGSSYPYMWMRDWILPRTANNQRDDHWHYGGHFVDGRWIDHWTFLDLPLEKKVQEDHRQGRYWRYITIEGLFDKNQTTTNNDLRCFSGEGLCGDHRAKELRFCTVVIYSSPYQGVVTLCSVMTNFLE